VSSKEQLLERERRWALPTATATMAAIAMLVASTIVLAGVSGDGEAEFLRSADSERSSLITSSVLSAIGFTLLVAPLLYLFRAALARSGGRMRGQLVGVVVAAPLFLAASGALTGVVTSQAASDFVDDPPRAEVTRIDVAPDCRRERDDVGAESFREEYVDGGGANPLQACVERMIEDDTAENVLDDSGLRPLTLGLGFGGRLGLAVTLVYTCLFAMRVGLLSRFWGSLGMALGVASFLILQFTLIWFLYLGLLIAGWVPGGRPPAWAAGEAIPWPAPGEGSGSARGETVEGTGSPVEGSAEEAERRRAANPPRPRGERRKRKRRG
jgi:hypothetical protein